MFVLKDQNNKNVQRVKYMSKLWYFYFKNDAARNIVQPSGTFKSAAPKVLVRIHARTSLRCTDASSFGPILPFISCLRSIPIASFSFFLFRSPMRSFPVAERRLHSWRSGMPGLQTKKINGEETRKDKKNEWTAVGGQKERKKDQARGNDEGERISAERRRRGKRERKRAKRETSKREKKKGRCAAEKNVAANSSCSR